MQTVRLRLLWHPQPQFAGALIAQHDGIARRRGIELQCQPMEFAQGPVAAVLATDADICVASPAHLLECADPSALVLLLAFQQVSPLIYPARRDQGVSGIGDLAGKRAAVWPGGEDLEFRWMLIRAGVSPDSVERVPTGDTVAALLEGEVACAQMTIYHEYHEFLDAGGRADAVIPLRAADYGADLIKDGVLARRDWVESDPTRAQAVVDSLLEGWTLALDDPAHAVDLCRAVRPDLDAAHQGQQYRDIRDLILTGATLHKGLGFPDASHMEQAARALAEVEGRALEMPAEDLIDFRFWQAAPELLRRTSFP
jgi:NitT/TauT family transport system substrate-binding protein